MQSNEIATQTDEVSNDVDDEIPDVPLYEPHNDEELKLPEELLDRAVE